MKKGHAIICIMTWPSTVIETNYTKIGRGLSALRSSAAGADEATFLIDQRLLSAAGAGLARSGNTVGQIALEGTFDTILPCIDGFVVE